MALQASPSLRLKQNCRSGRRSVEEMKNCESPRPGCSESNEGRTEFIQCSRFRNSRKRNSTNEKKPRPLNSKLPQFRDSKRQQFQDHHPCRTDTVPRTSPTAPSAPVALTAINPAKQTLFQRLWACPINFSSNTTPTTIAANDEHKDVLVWDTGATTCVSTNVKHFPEGVKPLLQPKQLTGVGSTVPVEGKGYVHWQVVDCHGRIRTLRLPALYVPKAAANLLSVQTVLQEYAGETINMTEARWPQSIREKWSIAPGARILGSTAT